MITVRSEGDDIVAILKDAPVRAQKSAVRALNRAIKSARTFMARAIAEDIGMPVGVVRDALSLREARMGLFSASLDAPLKRIPLIDLKAKGPVPSRGKGRGVTYQLKGGHLIPNAFIAQMKSGHTGVFKRIGKARLPIVELRGPSIGHVFEKYEALGRAKGEEAFAKNFAHEYEYAGTEGASAAETGALAEVE